MRVSGAEGIWLPRSMGEHYFNLMTRVLPLREQTIRTQADLIARLESVRADQDQRAAIQERMLADLRSTITYYEDEIRLREEMEDRLVRMAARSRTWKRLFVIAGVVATVAVLK